MNKNVNKHPKKVSQRKRRPPQIENFDHKPFPKDAFVIANMISVVQPELDEDERDIVASQISLAIKNYKIEPQIMVAIIDTESNFKADKVSTTGDLSLAQINCNVWNKEFVRMKRQPINKAKLVSDQQYALTKMAEILMIIKNRYGKKDRKWYARYHSNTKQYKNEYLDRLDIRMEMLAKASNLDNKIADTN